MTEKIKHICFDLDGTLVDSYKTIYNSTIQSLSDMKITNDIDELIFKKKIGMHFVDIFEEMNIPVPDFEEFISVYKNNYFLFIHDSHLYPEADTVLKQLSKKGYKISLLTTKAQDQAEKILNYFHVYDYFNVIMGRRNGIAHKPSAEPLLMICDELAVDSDESLIVGDTEMDIQCGKNADIKTCGAAYGYRSEEVLSSFHPNFIIRNLKELISILSG